MAKISKTWSTCENKWYDELKSIAPYIERQYEKIVLANLRTLFPEFHAVNYKKNIKSEEGVGASRPDFALIRKDYKEWWIVEVETIEDNLKHVSKQISNFTNGVYNTRDEAKYLFGLDNSLDFAMLSEMTKDNPKVLVLVDDSSSKWVEELSQYNPSICVFKVYRNNSGYELLSISGDYPYIFEDQSYCHLDDPFKGLMKLSNPDVIAPQMELDITDSQTESYLMTSQTEQQEVVVRESKKITISFKGQATEWALVEDNGEVFLQSVEPHALRANDAYLLKRTKGFGYIIELS